MTETLGATVSDERKQLEEFYNFGPRRPGSKIGREFEDHLFKYFENLGLSPMRQRIPIEAWECNEWALTVEREKVPAFYIPYTAFSPDEGVQAPLLHLNGENLKRLQPEIRGKIVVVDFNFPDLVGWQLKLMALCNYDPDKEMPNGSLHPATWIRREWKLYHEAVRSGAVGFIGILANQPGNHCSYFAPYGFREGDDILKKPIPGMWVSRSDGDGLRRAAASGKRATLTLKGRQYQSETSNIIGKIEGQSSGKKSRNFILGCHHDTPFKNAVEDSSGIVTLLRIASELKARATKLRHDVYIVATAGHFYGSIGTRKFIEEKADLHQDTDLAFWLEHFGFSAIEKDGALVSTGRPEPAGLFANFNKKTVALLGELVKKHEICPALVLPAESPLGDYPPSDGGDFYAHGIPIINYISNPVYLLVDDDRLEFVDYKRLQNFSAMAQDLLGRIDHLGRQDLGNKDYEVRHKLLAASAKLMARSR